MGLVTSFLFSLILEGVACLFWYIVFRSRDSSVTQPVMQLVPAIPELTRPGNADDARPLSEVGSKFEKLIMRLRLYGSN